MGEERAGSQDSNGSPSGSKLMCVHTCMHYLHTHLHAHKIFHRLANIQALVCLQHKTHLHVHWVGPRNTSPGQHHKVVGAAQSWDEGLALPSH